jgi:four helix bundle protein
LVAWQRAIELTDQVYACTRNWPKDEAFGLTAQIRRAAVSIAANIAEGQGRNGDREFINFLGIAHGSLCEVETLLEIAKRQAYLVEEEYSSILGATVRVASLIHGLKKSLRAH